MIYRYAKFTMYACSESLRVVIKFNVNGPIYIYIYVCVCVYTYQYYCFIIHGRINEENYHIFEVIAEHTCNFRILQ
jgi:hypothetical protein